MLIEPNLKHRSQIEFVQTIMQKHGEHKGQTCGQYVVTTTETAVSLPNIYIDIYDGSSKVLFPLLALNRNSMRDAFCFTCKKSYTENTSKMQ